MAVRNSVHRNSPVERGEASAVVACKREQINVSDHRWRKQVCASDMRVVDQRYVIGTELVARRGAESAEHVTDGARGAKMIRVPGLTRDPNHAVLDERRCEPVCLGIARGPRVRCLVEYVAWV